MTVVYQGKLKNMTTSTDEQYEIVRGIDLNNTVDAQCEWSSCMAQRLYELKQSCSSPQELHDALHEFGIQHLHWNWSDKAMLLSGNGYEWFYLLAEGKVQAISIIRHPLESRIDKANIIYIEYIAVAPWNKSSKIHGKNYGGLGKLLIQSLVMHSLSDFGYRAGFGLHSLPQSKIFYRGIGMTDFGNDSSHDGMHYFEMEEDASVRISRGEWP